MGRKWMRTVERRGKEVYVIYREATITVTRHRGFLGILTLEYPRGVMSTDCSVFCVHSAGLELGTSLGFFPATSITKLPFVVILFPAREGMEG